MSSPEAGWYDDPWSPDQYRYWDGSMWTPRAAPKHAPPPGPAAGYGGGPGVGPPTPYAGYGTTPQQWRPTFGPTTPDGVPLASRWARLGGRLLDNLFVTLASLPFNSYFLVQYNKAAAAWSDELDRKISNGETPNVFAFPNDMIRWLVPIMVVGIALGVAYEVFFLRRNGATPGKRIVGTAVRGYADPQSPPAMSAVARRCVVMFGVQVLYVVPLLVLPPAILLVGLLLILDNAWLLWDGQRQTLHDKAAATTVVRTR